MDKRQQYKGRGDINVTNRGMSEENIKKYHPGWLYILIGALLALQIVQFLLIGFLYAYIHSVEFRIEQDIRENGREIIRFMDRRKYGN